jgi:hypothetical protein
VSRRRENLGLLADLIQVFAFAAPLTYGASLFLWANRQRLDWAILIGSAIALISAIVLVINTMRKLNEPQWAFRDGHIRAVYWSYTLAALLVLTALTLPVSLVLIF